MNKRNINKESSTKEILIGLFMFGASLFAALALAFYNPYDAGFVVASNESKNILGFWGAYLADFLTQSLGLFAYPFVLLILVWGYNFISGKMHYLKYKWFLFYTFVFLGSIILNISSTNFYIANIIRKLKIEYYAGGFIGYSLSKIIFTDIFKQLDLCKWVFIGLLLVWFALFKKVFFISFDALIENSPRFWKWLKISSYKISSQKDLNKTPVGHKELPIKIETKNDEADVKRFDSAMIMGGGRYILPSVELLDKYNQKESCQDQKKIEMLSEELRNVLEEFGIRGEIINVKQGPVVTTFEFRPEPGIKTSRVISLNDDIARSMSAISARISTIPGQNAIGIELSNKDRHTVYLRELLASETFKKFSTGIPLILGKDISGNPIMADLTKMPHLLVAGTTGSGKSVSINDMVLSILFKFSPNDCKLIMIDPKMLELSVYDEIPHLLTPVVTNPKKAIFALKWAVAEMENRYRQMSKFGVRNIDGFNKKLAEARENGDFLVRKVQTGFDQETGRPLFETQQLEFKPMPYIVIIVDEMADLMLIAGKDVEAAIQRLAQMARAAGIHLIMATQRPSVDVITGTIKANFPTRISFQVTSKIDSRTILGEQGAEQLLGQGDMLYMHGAGRILRVHGPFVKDSEVEKIVDYIKGQGEPNYVDIVSDEPQEDNKTFDTSNRENDMYSKALEIVSNDRKISISYLQRKLQIGYNRAARIIEEMEKKGIVSPPNHTGKRDILI
ncbi:MAG: DNA translocase FtsK 4TM domain-containing protein [Holosporales bacterium]|jgi:S-DNA-T family DNA segregation ATPase FtsK/SpoIIIE|nr:DNA translocase FtsK 4TM domain-containing protein [Holosporales bacterium]